MFTWVLYSDYEAFTSHNRLLVLKKFFEVAVIPYFAAGQDLKVHLPEASEALMTYISDPQCGILELSSIDNDEINQLLDVFDDWHLIKAIALK
jgi:hypothetical protein